MRSEAKGKQVEQVGGDLRSMMAWISDDGRTRASAGGYKNRRSAGPPGWRRYAGALGVVFGDIGTSPLYALQTVFRADHGAVEPTQDDVYGVISLVFWSITIIVSIKYVTLIMRADNDGEGGIMALIALIQGVALAAAARRRSRWSRSASSARPCSTATA